LGPALRGAEGMGRPVRADWDMVGLGWGEDMESSDLSVGGGRLGVSLSYADTR
jgi:hypothetical protein